MLIFNAEPSGYSSEARALLASIGSLREVECDRKQLLDLVRDADVLIVRLGHRIDREVLQAGRRLRAIVTATTGLNHIDLDAAAERGIAVLSLRGESAFLDRVTATAELTWALLLALLRQLPAAHAHVGGGGWDRSRFRGRQLQGKTLGVVGLGRLGRMVAQYGTAFRMEVLATDPAPAAIPRDVVLVEMDELLRRSDVVTLHVSLDAGTRGLLDRRAFSLMKRSAVLINTSRGELLDEQALVDALRTGSLAGAALDVLAGEADGLPDWPRCNPVWRYAQEASNVLLTPHIGGFTFESLADAEVFMARKLADHLSRDEHARAR